jgi:hypothetical protein
MLKSGFLFAVEEERYYFCNLVAVMLNISGGE